MRENNQRRISKPKEMKAQYSGKKSKAFWKKIDNIEDLDDYQEAYLIGVILQDFERSLLLRLNPYLNKKK